MGHLQAPGGQAHLCAAGEAGAWLRGWASTFHPVSKALQDTGQTQSWRAGPQPPAQRSLASGPNVSGVGGLRFKKIVYMFRRVESPSYFFREEIVFN